MTASTQTRVAIVGAGPAGFYAADRLLKAGVEVELIDRLATPWGLVRAGVAPDHPKIKSVSRVFEKTAALEGFRFHGHVEAGVDVSHEELLAHHHAVIYTYGASADRRLGIPGENLPGSHAATDFVAWYNGHPDACDLEFDLSSRRAVVVGNGNVALDVARMLVLSSDELAVTDVADHALEALAESNVEEVVVLGRRGPEQAAYTQPELRELDGRPVVMRYFVSPTAILGAERVEGIELVRNELVDGRAVATGETERLDCQLVFRAIGYAGTPIAGVPFDERSNTIANQGGRVAPGVYAAGWIKRGPSGVIGTNKKCAYETVDALLADLDAGRLDEPSGDAAAFAELLAARCPERVDYGGWERIDAHERAAGEAAHPPRPRVKLTRREELAAHGSGVRA